MLRNAIAAVAAILVALCASSASAFGGQVVGESPSPVPEPVGLAVASDSLWVADMASRQVVKVQPASGQVLSRLDTPGFQPTGLAWFDETLWVADRSLDRIVRFRPSHVPDLAPIPYYERWPAGIVHDGDHLWVVDSFAAKIHQVDPEDGTTLRSFAAPDKRPTGIAFDGRFLWVADHGKDSLYRVDRQDGDVVTILPSPGPYPSALAVDGDVLWVADYQTQKLARVKLPDATPYVEDDVRRVRASYEVLYRANGAGSVEKLEVVLALPGPLPGQHLLGELTFEPQPQRIVEDRWGQKVAVFDLGSLPSGTTRRVRWEGDFALYRVRFHLDPDAVQVAKLPAGLDRYLEDDKKYDLGAPSIAKLVEELTRDEPTYYGRARAIYEHLTKVITYDRSSGWNNAATVLARGSGSCSEYTFALVALLRRAGIPARYVGAVSERGDDASFDDVFHRWAEAYMPGYGWVPIDANAGTDETPGGKASFFGGRSNRHVVTTIGGGSSEQLGWTYNSNETYGTRGGATLSVMPMARYRPLLDESPVEPHHAAAVLVPDLDRRISEGKYLHAEPASRGLLSGPDPWLVAIALLLATGLGLALGRLSRGTYLPSS